jgi:hypothetical protein
VMFTQTKGSMWHSVQNKFELGNVLLSRTNINPK